jgi:hypothetical protein
MNNKQRVGKNSTRDRGGRMGELWIMMENYWNILEMEIE